MDINYSIIGTVEDAKVGRLNLLACFDEEIKVELGLSSLDSARAAKVALDKAMADVSEGKVDALVIVPAAANDVLLKKPEVLVIRTVDELRVSLLTNELALREVADAITRPRVVEKVTLFYQALRRDLRISAPRIAVLSLNPVVKGMEPIGTEEREEIIPAIEELSTNGIQAFGPYPADEFFGCGAYTKFDGVLAMYHDQGMTPFRSITIEEGILLLAGLPFVVTAPAISEDFTKAGQGVVDATPLRQAIYAAIDFSRNRVNYDEPMGNPLPKLYKEKRDDSEKVRFAVRAKDQFKKEDHPAPGLHHDEQFRQPAIEE
jgi:4-hydroxythreonine-4-phosphate dehydrogenase